MWIRYLRSGVLAAVASSMGITTMERLEKRVAGGKALSVRGLIARHTLLAAVFRQMKQDHSKRG